MKIMIEVSEEVSFEVVHTDTCSYIQLYMKGNPFPDFQLRAWGTGNVNSAFYDIAHSLRCAYNFDGALDNHIVWYTTVFMAQFDKSRRAFQKMNENKELQEEQANDIKERAKNLKTESTRLNLLSKQNRKRTSNGRSLSGIILESDVRRNLNRYTAVKARIAAGNKHYNHPYWRVDFSTEGLKKYMSDQEAKGNTVEKQLQWLEGEYIELPDITDTKYSQEEIDLVTKYTLLDTYHEYYNGARYKTKYNDYIIDTDRHQWTIDFGTHEEKQIYLDQVCKQLNYTIESWNRKDLKEDINAKQRPLLITPIYNSEEKYNELFTNEEKLGKMKTTILIALAKYTYLGSTGVAKYYYKKEKPELHKNRELLVKTISQGYNKATKTQKYEFQNIYEKLTINKAIQGPFR